jgi:hypothetical protein
VPFLPAGTFIICLMLKPFCSFFLLISVLFMCSCASQGLTASDKNTVSYPATVLYYIHGDGDYLYHDLNGKKIHADLEQLAKARQAAAGMTSSEVFIFHHPRQGILRRISGRPGAVMYHYREGSLIRRQSYSPGNVQSFLAAESELYRRHRAAAEPFNSKRYFLFFGHEIPVKPSAGYFVSGTGPELYADEFASGLALFGDDRRKPADVLVLSSCSNGSPEIISRLYGTADYVVASPQNLHLSYLDTSGIIRADKSRTGPGETARGIAENSYRQLSDRVQTAVTVSLYEMEKLSGKLTCLQEAAASERQPSSDRTDCALVNGSPGSWIMDGVEVWYRAPRFGHGSAQQTHSGWGCR